jgi:hypothetical protein
VRKYLELAAVVGILGAMTVGAVALITLIIIDSVYDDGGRAKVVESPTSPTPSTFVFPTPAFPPDLRAVALNVGPTTRAGSRVSPGDWVDIQAAYYGGAVRTIVEAVQVLSVASERPLPADPEDAFVRIDTGRDMVTVLVTPEAARLLQENTTYLVLSRSPHVLPDYSE